MQVIIGNVIMAVASVFLVLSSTAKNQNKSLFWQTCQLIGMSVGNIVFGSIPGLISNLFTLCRNVLAYKGKLNWTAKIVIIALSSAVSLAFNTIGVFVIFPLCSLILFTLFIDTENIVLFKTLLLLNCSCWLIHDIYIQSYVVALFNVISIISIAIQLCAIPGQSRVYAKEN